MRKVKVRTLYLIAIIVGGLVGLATKSTYAMFTASAEIDNPICMSANLTSEEETIETMEVSLTSGETKIVPITINNTSTGTVSYSVWYDKGSNNVDIGVKLSNSDSSNSTGTISSNGSKKVYVVIRNNEASDITLTLGVISNATSNDMTLVPNNGLSSLKPSTFSKYITWLYDNASKEIISYTPTNSYYMQELTHNLVKDDYGNIRYYGASPNNYIYFNCSNYSNQSSSTCETWRIIGVFDGKVKIMRGSQIGTYSWDTSDSGTNSGNGVNEWSQADLMKLLNSGYESESVGGSLYWNAKSGTCYNKGKNTTVSCNFTSTGLKNDTTRNMIAETTYYTRGYSDLSIYAEAMYNKERVRGIVYDSTRTLTWTGKIAIPYPSDYGYAADLELCQKDVGYYDYTTCKSNNWMKNIITNNGDNFGWLLSPSSTGVNYAWHVYSTGTAFYGDGTAYFVSSAYGVTPVLFLNSEQTFLKGTGTRSDPYQLSV